MVLLVLLSADRGGVRKRCTPPISRDTLKGGEGEGWEVKVVVFLVVVVVVVVVMMLVSIGMH